MLIFAVGHDTMKPLAQQEGLLSSVRRRAKKEAFAGGKFRCRFPEKGPVDGRVASQTGRGVGQCTRGAAGIISHFAETGECRVEPSVIAGLLCSGVRSRESI